MNNAGRNGKFIAFVVFAFITLFTYTAVNKLWDIDFVEKSLRSFPLIGSMAPLLSWAIPLAELVVVAVLFIPRTRNIGLLLSTLLMISFTFYIIYLKAVSSILPCTCGGMISHLSWDQHLIVNIIFIVLGIASIYLTRRSQRKMAAVLSPAN